MPKNRDYPINNQVLMPFYIEFFLEKKLVNVHIKEVTKDPKRPATVILAFDNEILKKLILDTFGLSRWMDKKTSFGNDLTLKNWRAIRSEAKNKSDDDKQIFIAKLVRDYCDEMRAYLLQTLVSSKKTLAQFNPEFNAQYFINTCKTTNTVDDFKIRKTELDEAIAEAVTVRKLAVREAMPDSTTGTPSSTADITTLLPHALNLSVQVSASQADDEKEIHTPEPSPSTTVSPSTYASSPQAKPKVFSSFPPNYNPDAKDSGMPDDEGGEIKIVPYTPERYQEAEASSGAPMSPTSPAPIHEKVGRGKYTEDMITFMYLCNNTPIPPNPRIDISKVSCCISTRICQIPVLAGGKLYDIFSLNLLVGFKTEDHFVDPDTQLKIYKSALVPAYEVRTKIFDLIKEEDFYQAFLRHYAEDYKKAGVFKWSNFNKLHKNGEINNFDDLFKYVVNHPDSRSAKVFANMTETVNDRFKIFMKTYLKDYQLKNYFNKRSIFLKKVRKDEIKDIETTEDYATQNTHTRTNRLLSNFPR